MAGTINFQGPMAGEIRVGESENSTCLKCRFGAMFTMVLFKFGLTGFLRGWRRIKIIFVAFYLGQIRVRI